MIYALCILLIFASGYRSALFIERRKPRVGPTRLQLALSASGHREIRANRMLGILDGWQMAWRIISRN